MHKGMTLERNEFAVDDRDDAFREMVHNFLAFAVRLEQIRSRFGALIGLSGVQFTLLISIRQLQGARGVGVKALADHLALSPQFVTGETTKLVRQGLVTKAPNPDDQRRVHLEIAPAGAALLARLAPIQQEVNELLFEPVTGENYDSIRQMAAALRKSAEGAVLLSDYLIGAERGQP